MFLHFNKGNMFTMKKYVLILVLTFVAAGAFAAGFGFSVGGGLLFDYSANNGIEQDGDYLGHRTTSFGGFAFFDATYAELDISFAYGSVTTVAESPSQSISIAEDSGSMLQLGFSLLGKYPININKKFILFPLLGINYNRVLSYTEDGEDVPKAGELLSQFGFQGGIGFDFFLSKTLFLRGEALFQFRFPGKLYEDYRKDVNLIRFGGTGKASTTYGMGPVIKAAVGYKF